MRNNSFLSFLLQNHNKLSKMAQYGKMRIYKWVLLSAIFLISMHFFVCFHISYGSRKTPNITINAHLTQILEFGEAAFCWVNRCSDIPEQHCNLILAIF